MFRKGNLQARQLLLLLDKITGLQEVNQFCFNYQKLYKKSIYKSNYFFDFKFAKEPIQKVHLAYKQYQDNTFKFIKSKKQIASPSHLRMILEIVQYHPEIKLKHIQQYLQSHYLRYPVNLKQDDLVKILTTADNLYKQNLQDNRESEIMLKILDFVINKINTAYDVGVLCKVLKNIRIIKKNHLQKLTLVIQQIKRKNNIYKLKQMFFNTLELYSNLPMSIIQTNLNQFFMDSIWQNEFAIQQKIRILVSLANFEQDELNQLNYLLFQKKQELFNEIYSIQVHNLQPLTKLKLFHFFRLYNQPENINTRFIDKQQITILLNHFITNKSLYTSTLENQIQQQLIQMNWKYTKQAFFQSFFVDFLIQNEQKYPIVLQVDGPYHFWLIDGKFEYSKDQKLRQKIWKRVGVRMGGIPFYIWNKCKSDMQKRILIRWCLQNKSLDQLMLILK